MRFREVQAKVRRAVKQLNQEESSLLKRDISERAIVHQFAIKLASVFESYTVDCEYNGNVNGAGDDIKKQVGFLAEHLKRVKKKYEHLPDDSVEQLGVFPDVIIHERKTNATNLLIIEAKKFTSKSDEVAFDRLKMKYYTEYSDVEQKPFVYDYGLLITFRCKQNAGLHKLEWYKDGVCKTAECLPFSFR